MGTQTQTTSREESSFVTGFDLHLLFEGTHLRLYEKFGAHPTVCQGENGTYFALWAPNAEEVSVIGDFNDWNSSASPLNRCARSGVWSNFIPGVSVGAAYKYHITSRHQKYRVQKADPFRFRQENSLCQSSLVSELSYDWGDGEWMANRGKRNQLQAPQCIYEVHLGSWMRVPEEGNRPLTYRELGSKLADYISRLGFTHVELMPVMEQAVGGPYQVTGYFASAHRQGSPQDLMYLIDSLHQKGIGVFLDWVPAHFASAAEGLAYFDGTQLYERGFCNLLLAGNPQGCSFDYARPEVRSFLLSSAFFWLDKFHADGLRLDSLGAALYLDFARGAGKWVPNRYGGRENLEGCDFLRQLTTELNREFPDTQSIAADTAGWPLVTASVAEGGLGFGLKWDAGFVQDALVYLGQDPLVRKRYHHQLIARESSSVGENVLLPLSHQHASPGGCSLLTQMAGDEWQRFANLRLLLGWMYLQPGKKLLFMGDEFAQWQPWNPEASLDWHLCAFPHHAGMQRWVSDLNRLYREEPALYESDSAPGGFEWLMTDAEQSTVSWFRRDLLHREALLVICNFTPVVRRNYRLGVRRGGWWREMLNSDAKEYGGSGQGNFGGTSTAPFSCHGRSSTLAVTLPPLATVVFKHQAD